MVFSLLLVAVSAFAHDNHTTHVHPELHTELEDDPVYVSNQLIDLQSKKQYSRSQILRSPEFSTQLFIGGAGIDGRYLKLAKGQLLLTIDDGPTPRVTAPIVELLNRYNIRGVFFVVGNLADSRPGIMSEIASSGHIVANHTYYHELDFKNANQLYTSLIDTNRVIEPYQYDTARCYFRAPGGVWNDWRKDLLNSHPELRKCIGPFFWNIGGGLGTADWNCWKGNKKTPLECAQGYYQEMLNKGKGVVLIHDVRPQTFEMLGHLLKMMQREGIKNQEGSTGDAFWEFVDLDESSELDQLEVE